MPLPLILSTLPPPLNAQPRPIEAPLALVRWHLSSCLPLVRRLVVASPVVACLYLASPFVAQPPHASILDPSSLFAPAGSPMFRRSCRRCAGVFAGVAIAIVTLVARRQAGVIALVVVVVNVCCHCCRRRCPSRSHHRRRRRHSRLVIPVFRNLFFGQKKRSCQDS